MRLTRLASSLQSIPHVPSIISALRVIGFVAAEDLAFASPHELWARLNESDLNHDLSLPQIEALCDEVASILESSPLDGNAKYRQEKQAQAKRPPARVGIPALDEIVGDAFSGAQVVEITGPSGSGRSLLALHVVLRNLWHDPGLSALWIDTTTSRFLSHRTVDILNAMGVEPRVHKEVLDRLTVSFCASSSSLSLKLEEFRRSSDDLTYIQPRFIILDTATAVFAPILAEQSSQGPAIMTSIMQQLSILAHTFNLTAIVITTSQYTHSTRVLAFSPGELDVDLTLKPIGNLQPTWQYLTDTTLGLAMFDALPENDEWGWHTENLKAEREGKKVHVAQVLRARRMGITTNTCFFVIRERAIVESFALT